MDRLTKYQPTEGGVPYVVFNDPDPAYCTGDHWQDALQRLAAYEDTGLEPEAISETIQYFNVLVEADNEGRLIVLPCKVGDTVWEFKYGCTIGPDDLCYVPSKACGNCKSLTCSIMPRKVIDVADAALLTRRWGKTIFRTREEAEAALGGAEHV